MRFRYKPQIQLGTTPIDDIVFDICSRHEMVPILMALQHLYVDHESKINKILELIENDVKAPVNSNRGSIGMSYWETLVLTAVRLGCDTNYDCLADLATHHRLLRQMLGISDWDLKRFSRSAVHENLTKLSPATIDAINYIIVDIGHKLSRNPLKKVRADTFVVQKNIHYPTDTNLLNDGSRKVIEISKKIADEFDIQGWRKGKHLKKQIKMTQHKISKVARSRAADRDDRLKALYEVMMDQAEQIIIKAEATLYEIDQKVQFGLTVLSEYWKGWIGELQFFITGTEYVMDLARRRILFGETIPNPDKVFSLFEPDTELINRGKHPNPIEFGHRVLIVQDNAGFIVHGQVLGNGFTDEKIITDVMKNLQRRYKGRIQAASFDKGFWTPNNFEALSDIIPLVALPKKGRRNELEREREASGEFRKVRKWHSGVESAIHALVAGNGMKVCRDKGPTGYKRYIAMAILGRNLQQLGNILIKKERKRTKGDPLMEFII